MKTKKTLREEAKARQAKHDLLTPELKLAKLDTRDGNAARERSRLTPPPLPRSSAFRRASRRVIASVNDLSAAIATAGAAAAEATPKVVGFNQAMSRKAGA